MLRLVVLAVGFTVATVVLLPFQWVAVKHALPLRQKIPTVFHRIVCALVGVRVHEVGRPAADRPLLIVANHVSWIDIAAVTSRLPVVFVAKSEVATWPLFGLFAKLQRSVFVDRARRSKTREVNAEIAQRLAEGDPVVLFGEGTSSDGNRVLPFRSALIGAAGDALAEAEAGRPVHVQPLSIAYTRYQGVPMGRQFRPLAAWYGSIDLVPHLARIGSVGAVDMVLTWGEPVAYDAASDRKAVTRLLEERVRTMTAEALHRGAGFPPARPTAGRRRAEPTRTIPPQPTVPAASAANAVPIPEKTR